MFTMEAWFRMDPIDIRPNGYISQVFSLYDSDPAVADYRLGFAISNTFLRVYLDDTIEDIHYRFDETRDYWHFVAVSYARHFERETILKVFIDQSLVYSQKVFDWHAFDMGKTTYELQIGKEFPGVIRKARINARAHCDGHENTLLVNTDPSKCVQKGTSPCNFCDIMQPAPSPPAPLGSYECFPTCPDFGHWVDANGDCHECHKACRYCKDADSREGCYLCNSTGLFVQDTSKALTLAGVAQSADLMTCKCAEGTITNDQKFCR